MSEEKNMHFGWDIIPKFDGIDKTYSVTKWTNDIEDNREIFNWTPQQTLIIARRSLTGTAEKWLKSEKVFKTYEDLQTALLKEFPDTLNSKEMHELMAGRKKQAGESYYEYMLTMKELGKRAKFADYVAIQYIVDGIQDYPSNKAILYGVTTYSLLKERLATYETIKNRTKMAAEISVRSRVNPKNREVQGRRIVCFKCGEGDHLAKACTKGVKCFRCNSFGHKATECQQAGISNRRTVSEQKSMCVKISPLEGDSVKTDRSDGIELVNDVSELSVNCQCHSVMNVNKVKCPRNNCLKSIKIGSTAVKSLIDSGSDLNLLSSDIFFDLDVNTYNKTKVMLTGLGSAKVYALGNVDISIEIDGFSYNGCFYIVPESVMPYKVILGQPFLTDTTIIMEKGNVTIMPYENDDNLLSMCLVEHEQVSYVPDSQIRAKAQELVSTYQPRQVKEAPIEMKIILKDEVPVAQRPRRLSLAEQKVVETQVSEWLKDGIIRPSFSEYASPLVLVKKKDGTTRVCVDYRLVNQKMVKDEFPLPIIEDHIDKLSESKVFSKLDLKDAFFHLKVTEDSIKYTAFVTHHGQFEFLRAPFGLSICPKYFTRFITTIFRELIAKGHILLFIDDAIIPANGFQEAVERLEEVLKVASSYGLQINWKKSEVLTTRVEYLGHIVENGEIRPAPEKTDAVMKFPEPKTVKQVQSFIGLASYFRKYIQHFSVIARPLTDMLKKDQGFIWGHEQRCAFITLKEKLGSGPVLKIFNPKRSTELHTDASSVAYAAILMQVCEDGELHPVYYMSRKTNDAERKYPSYELEALAVIEGIKRFRHYLYGIRFKVVTDCQAFQMTIKKKDLCTRVARWSLLLQEFDFQVEHRPGSKMKHVDALSRNPYIAIITRNLNEQIKKAQQQDEGLITIMEILKEKPHLDYYMDNGLLYKGLERQLVIPAGMETEIIRSVHSNGHFGKKKMTDIICKDYYIKDLAKKLEDYIVTCIPCILGNRKEGRQEGLLHILEKEDSPLHTLHIDHLGPMTETKKLYNHIFTIVDGFTKFVWVFPTKSTTSKETLEKLKIHQQHYGNPTRFISDKGTAFTSQEFKNYCEEENIKHCTITTGIPRGNGQVERIHRTIISVLTKLNIDQPDHWYKHVSRLQRALNSTWQRSIACTPFELLIGKKMNNKEDIQLYDLILQEQKDTFLQDREEQRKRAKENILQIQEENRRSYNKKRKESTIYKEGDWVAIKRTQFGSGLKLKPKYLGPYRVTKVKGNDRYDVEKVDSAAEGPGKSSSAADFMKRWPDSINT